MAFPRLASPINAVPTGFWAVPPSGPAIPVVERANVVPLRCSAPSAMARATSSLTAPATEISSAETPNVRVFASLEYVTFPSINTAEDPGTSVTRFASNPPVHDSAVAKVATFAFRSWTMTSSNSFSSVVMMYGASSLRMISSAPSTADREPDNPDVHLAHARAIAELQTRYGQELVTHDFLDVRFAQTGRPKDPGMKIVVTDQALQDRQCVGIEHRPEFAGRSRKEKEMGNAVPGSKIKPGSRSEIIGNDRSAFGHIGLSGDAIRHFQARADRIVP